MRTISLRKAAAEDALLIAGWYNDSDNIKYMSTVVRERKHTPASVKRDIENSDPGFERLFMVEADGEVIGHCGIDDIDIHDQRAEIFFLIGVADARGKGIGKEIGRLLLEHAFGEMGLNSLYATAAVENEPSIRILEHLGFKRIGVRRQYNKIGEKFVDEILFDMLKDEYLHA
jgi:RimJ/RimL family protein N-acetyltransferase